MTSAALVLHDDQPTLALVRDILTTAGLAVRTVPSAFQLVAADNGDAPSLVVLGITAIDDREMEIVTMLRKRWPETTILTLFPSSLRERSGRALSLGADACLPEPFYPGELLAIAQRVVSRTPVAPTAALDATPPAAAQQRIRGGVVEQLAAGVAHSIRNPLQILELQLGSVDGEGSIDVEGMREQVHRIAEVVEGLTRFSGHRDMALRPVDVNDLVMRVFTDPRRTGSGAKMIVRCTEETAEVLGAPELLRAGFECVLDRAERVTPASSRIDVRTQVVDESGKKHVEVAVTDGGTTVADERRSRLFDPYPDPQTMQDGTGLELAGLAGIVRDHGGTVAALPGSPAGTTILIRLPVRSDAGAGAPARPRDR